MKRDPKVRKDGRCARCRNPIVVAKHAMRYAGLQLLFDPFCSTVCCREWHGATLEKPLPGRSRTST